MTDATRLLHGLEEYHAALTRQLVTLGEHHERLRAAWLTLRDVYEGTGADVFAEAWERADAGFQRYLTDGVRIQALLQRKVEALRAYDAPGQAAP